MKVVDGGWWMKVVDGGNESNADQITASSAKKLILRKRRLMPVFSIACILF